MTNDKLIDCLKGKKLLILAGASLHCKVVEAAKQLGVYTIVTDYMETSPAKEMADEKWLLNITDVDAIVERCKAVNIDGVLSVCIDPAQRPYQQICERLGLPCFGNKQQHYILTDKQAFKNFCIENSVDTIFEYTIGDIREDNVVYPILIKPVDSRGSRGQTVCYSVDTTEEAIRFAKSESSNGNIIIEKYMAENQDFSMSYLVVNGEPHLIRTGDRYLGHEADGLSKQCIFAISPSFSTDLYLRNVHPKVVDFIKNLGIQNAPLFMQGFLDGDTVRFYDPGLRLPGTEYEILFSKATGTDLMKILVTFALTGIMVCNFGSVSNGYRLNGKYAVQMYISARAGLIAVFEGLDRIAKHPDIISISQRYEVGETIPSSGDVKQRVCEIGMLASDADSARKLVKWVQSNLIVLDEKHENMLVSLIDPDLL
ncbi:MAG TPA: hypothetical protein DIW17_13195 [Clostridiales bacterium]|nr:hypothetical protein [Clostridiales bacterium]